MPGDGVLTMAGTLVLTVPALPAGSAGTGATDAAGGASAAAAGGAGGAGGDASTSSRTVTLSTEAEAQAFLSEMALASASLRSAALADSSAALQAQETARSLEAHAAQLSEWVKASRAERTSRAGAVVTHEQRARAAESFYNGRFDAIAAVFRAPTLSELPLPAAADAAGASASSPAVSSK